MRRGDWAAAWEVSDAVLRARDPATRDDPARPYHERWVWDGRLFAGQDVLVRCYHGLGDTLQFCRFLPLLRSQVRSLTLEVQPELMGLLAALPGPDRLHPFDPAHPLPPSACDLEVMELSHALRAPPDGAPYLPLPPLPVGEGRGEGGRSAAPGNGTGPDHHPKQRTPPPLISTFSRREKEQPRIGLCWAAGGWDPGRSLPLPMLAPLRALPGVHAVSLQRGPAADGWPGGDTSMDVARTARIIAGLDLVVTVDTMVAHLAGALGRPACVLLQRHADWRWGEGDSSPWYAASRLYRQDEQDEWRPPVARLVDDVAMRLLLPGGLVSA